MSILPKNELKAFDKTPRSFLIWGESMSGKTYLARQFESPIIINTDGNGLKVDTPCVEVRNFSEFANVIHALQTETHTYKTIIIDLIDDIEVMLSNAICESEGVEAISDIKWGKGYSKQSSIWKKLMMELTQMTMTVIFVSHCIEKMDDNQTSHLVPSLSQKGLNACMGRCDLSIQCKKIGNNYLRLMTARREKYVPEDIKNQKVLEILKTVMGVFEKPIPSPVIKTPVAAPKITPKIAPKTPVKAPVKTEPKEKLNLTSIVHSIATPIQVLPLNKIVMPPKEITLIKEKN